VRVSVLWRDCLRQSGRKALIFFAILFHRTPRDKVLQFLVGPETEHFLAAAGRITRAQIFVHDVEELFELERRTPGKHRNQFLGHQIGNSTGKCIFLKNSHKTARITHFGELAADFIALNQINSSKSAVIRRSGRARAKRYGVSAGPGEGDAAGERLGWDADDDGGFPQPPNPAPCV
jgi:hypothetical protein